MGGKGWAVVRTQGIEHESMHNAATVMTTQRCA